MSQLTLESLEERLAQLELQMARFMSANHTQSGRDDWKQSIGIITDDEATREIIDGALRLREEERAQVLP